MNGGTKNNNNKNNKNMKVNLTQNEIDKIYFTLKDYVKMLNDVDYLNELNEFQKQEFKTELELIKNFSKL